MFATTQNRVIAALVVVVVVLLLVIAFLAGRGSTSKTAGETSTHVSPSASVASPSAVASPSPVSDFGKPVGGDNAELKKGAGFDPAAGRGNAGTCDVWLDAGWNHSDCGLIFVGSQVTNGNAIAYMVEKKTTGSGTAWRAFLMTTTDTDAYWHTKLFIGDETGGAYQAVVVKQADVTGGGRPDVEMGFRKAGGALVYDVVQKSATNLDVVVHRERAGGRVTFAGGHVADYQDNGGDWLKDVVTYTPTGWVISSSDHVAPARRTGRRRSLTHLVQHRAPPRRVRHPTGGRRPARS